MGDAVGGNECASQTAVGSCFGRHATPSQPLRREICLLTLCRDSEPEPHAQARAFPKRGFRSAGTPLKPPFPPSVLRIRCVLAGFKPDTARRQQRKRPSESLRQGRPLKIDGLYLRQYSGSSTSSALHTSMQASRQAASAFSRLPLASIAAEASVMTWVSNPSRAASIAVNETQ